MKKIVNLLILIVIITIILNSCGYVRIDTDRIEDFETTFLNARTYCLSPFLDTEYSEEYGCNVAVYETELLPSISQKSKIVSYYVKCVEELPVGESVQILVSVRFHNSDSYKAEFDRLSNIKKSKRVLLNNDLFDVTAIISSASLLNVCEYVICSDDDLTLTYVYLQSVKEDSIIFDDKYLPKGYCDYGKIEKLQFTIYPDVN